MAIQHILPTKVYTAYELYKVSQCEPFGYIPIKRWKRLIFQKKRTDGKQPLIFHRGKCQNSSYRVLGDDFLDFALQF